MTDDTAGREAPRTDSPYAWWRLFIALLLSTVGGAGMWSVVVALPAVQADFGIARADASLPYTLTMVCFGFGGIAMGRLSDRFGIIVPAVLGTVILAAGFGVASLAGGLTAFALAQGLLIGVGASSTFGPLLADTSQWFVRRRGIAVAIAASGNYLAGTLWPPVIQHFIATSGWRATYLGLGLLCLVTMLPLAAGLRRRHPPAVVGAGAARTIHPVVDLSPRALQTLLVIAGFACCVAMSMPQVHIVAYCADLGYGPARGAQMLSVMLGCGIVSRLTFGWISDRIGGLRTLLLGSGLQCAALILFLPFDGLVSLFLVSALFGLFQGGIVPSYAIIVREFFPAKEAGARVGTVIMATLFGMALGGWLSGVIFDLTGSYRAAFLHGIAWNVVNLVIAGWLLRRGSRSKAAAVPA
jgi:MFS family permease